MENNKNSNQKENIGKEKKSRRNFLVTAGNSAIAIAALGSIGVTLDFLSPKVIQEIPTRFKIGNLSAIKSNSVTFDAEHNIFVIRDEQGYFYVLSAVCTHLGCTGRWKETGTKDHPEGVISCPCHGSVFSKHGEVLNGPATRSLDRYKMYLDEDKIIVNMAEKVSKEEMILKV